MRLFKQILNTDLESNESLSITDNSQNEQSNNKSLITIDREYLLTIDYDSETDEIVDDLNIENIELNEVTTERDQEFEISDINVEIRRSVEEVEKLKFDNIITLDINPSDANIEPQAFDDEMDEYDITRGDPNYELLINLGTNDLARYSCACHKANIAVRMAIKKHVEFSKFLAKLSLFAASTRKSIIDSKIHIEENHV